jgi:hypothetical protein
MEPRGGPGKLPWMNVVDSSEVATERNVTQGEGALFKLPGKICRRKRNENEPSQLLVTGGVEMSGNRTSSRI